MNKGPFQVFLSFNVKISCIYFGCVIIHTLLNYSSPQLSKAVGVFANLEDEETFPSFMCLGSYLLICVLSSGGAWCQLCQLLDNSLRSFFPLIYWPLQGMLLQFFVIHFESSFLDPFIPCFEFSVVYFGAFESMLLREGAHYAIGTDR